MAKQAGQYLIEGTIDNLTFSKTEDGYLVKKKSRLSREKVLTDPDFAQTRYNAQEFKEAIKSGQVIRSALHSLIKPLADTKLSSRMNTALLKVVQSDPEGTLGERKASNGDPTLLKGFEFNRHLTMKKRFSAAYTISHDETNNLLHIDIPGFKPSSCIESPQGAHSFRLVCGVGVVNLEERKYAPIHKQESVLLPLRKTATDAIRFSLPTQIAPDQTLFAVLGIWFYGELENIPAEAVSKRKMRFLKGMADEEGNVRFTGMLKVIEVMEGIV
jgi:hypothetical protein